MLAGLFGRLGSMAARLGMAGGATAVCAATWATVDSSPAHVACASPTNDGTTTERETGKTFLSRVTMASGVEGVLTGVACRRRFGLIPVYAVGLYVSESDAASIPSPTIVLRGTVEAELQLKFSRHVERDVMINSIKSAMEPRMPEGQTGALNGFIDALSNMLESDLKDGTTLGFHWDSGVLTTYLEGDHHEHRVEMGIRSEALPRALFAVYLDSNAVVPSDKFSKGLERYRARQ